MKQIKFIHEFIRLILNKYQQGWRKSEEIDTALHSAQLSFFMERLGNPAEYQPGRPVPRIAFPITQKITEDLRVFIAKFPISVPADGKISLPEGYVHIDYLRRNAPADKEYKFELVDGNMVADRVNSEIVAPTLLEPIAEPCDTYFQAYPKNVGSVTMSYLRLPQPVKWAYDINMETGEYEYNDADSIDIEWPPITHNEIAFRALKLLGINLKDGEVLQFSQLQKQQGS